MSPEKYDRLKKAAEKARQLHERAVGAASHLQEQMAREFQCGSLDEARSLLRERKKAAGVAETRFNREMSRFMKKWEGFLSEHQ